MNFKIIFVALILISLMGCHGELDSSYNKNKVSCGISESIDENFRFIEIVGTDGERVKKSQLLKVREIYTNKNLMDKVTKNGCILIADGKKQKKILIIAQGNYAYEGVIEGQRLLLNKFDELTPNNQQIIKVGFNDFCPDNVEYLNPEYKNKLDLKICQFGDSIKRLLPKLNYLKVNSINVQICKSSGESENCSNHCVDDNFSNVEFENNESGYYKVFAQDIFRNEVGGMKDPLKCRFKYRDKNINIRRANTFLLSKECIEGSFCKEIEVVDHLFLKVEHDIDLESVLVETEIAGKKEPHKNVRFFSNPRINYLKEIEIRDIPSFTNKVNVTIVDAAGISKEVKLSIKKINNIFEKGSPLPIKSDNQSYIAHKEAINTIKITNTVTKIEYLYNLGEKIDSMDFIPLTNKILIRTNGSTFNILDAETKNYEELIKYNSQDVENLTISQYGKYLAITIKSSGNNPTEEIWGRTKVVDLSSKNEKFEIVHNYKPEFYVFSKKENYISFYYKKDFFQVIKEVKTYDLNTQSLWQIPDEKFDPRFIHFFGNEEYALVGGYRIKSEPFSFYTGVNIIEVKTGIIINKEIKDLPMVLNVGEISPNEKYAALGSVTYAEGINEIDSPAIGDFAILNLKDHEIIYKKSSGAVIDFQFSPDSNFLIINIIGGMEILDILNREIVFKKSGISGAFSKTGSLIIDGNEYGEWENYMKFSLKGPKAIFKPGDIPFIFAFKGTEIDVVHARTGNVHRKIEFGNKVLSISFTPDGENALVATENGQIHFLYLNDKKDKKVFEDASGAKFSKDGNYLLFIKDGQVEVYNRKEFTLFKIFLDPLKKASFAEFDQEGNRLAINYELEPGKNLLKILQLNTGDVIKEFKLNIPNLFNIDFFPKEIPAFFFDQGNALGRISWNSNEDKVEIIPRLRGYHFSPDKKMLTLAFNGIFDRCGKLLVSSIYNITLPPPQDRICENIPRLSRTFYHDIMPVRFSTFSPDGRYLFVSFGETPTDDSTLGIAKIYEIETAREIQKIKHAQDIFDASFSSDGKNIILIGKENNRENPIIYFKIPYFKDTI